MKIVIFSGAGISAESGIKTFRDAGGLWEGHDVMEVASPEGWNRDPELVLDFYNQRRSQLLSVEPNLGHISITNLEENHDVVVVTQNVDDLHERAGNSKVIHLHGELLKVRSLLQPSHIVEWKKDLHLGDLCPQGGQYRPHIVWFGESVPMMDYAAKEVMSCECLIVVGTSLQVYPAAGLLHYAPEDCQKFYIDPSPKISSEINRIPNLKIIAEPASIGLPRVVTLLNKS